MLHTLHIQNLALIERAEVRLAAGLTVVSGETGGGKSLLIAALALLRGEKAAGTLVRHGADELQVDGEFRLGGGERSAAIANLVQERCGAAIDDDLLLVTRIVDRQGRTRVRIGGWPATLAALRELGALLLEIHGQVDTRALMRPEAQVETLDAFAGTAG
ncbi:MAG: AAA family ATPase, partial [Planctomycetota bacterium]